MKNAVLLSLAFFALQAGAKAKSGDTVLFKVGAVNYSEGKAKKSILPKDWKPKAGGKVAAQWAFGSWHVAVIFIAGAQANVKFADGKTQKVGATDFIGMS